MKSTLRTLLLLALLALLLVSHVRAQDAEDEGEVEEADEAGLMNGYDDGAEPRAPYLARAIFPNSTASVVVPKFPAGAPATTLIAFQNTDPRAEHQVVLVAAYLQQIGNYASVLQNFSVVRQARTVKPTETATFQYTFTPDSSFELGEYNLVLGVYYVNTADNATSFAVGYNGTVYIDDPLGSDPRTILTYLTLFAIFGAVAYYFADRFGVIKMIKASRREAQHSSHKPQQVEVGTRGQGYDPEYVSKEHVRYRDEVLRHQSASLANRRPSASPKKKN